MWLAPTTTPASEVVLRRFRGLTEREEPLPDLLLVDGGKGQLASAYHALQELGLGHQAIVGLAKRLEEIFVPGDPTPIVLPKTSASLRALQVLRDEAHRFALRQHRRLRDKRTLSSTLDNIPGVGRQRKQALLRHFGSVAGIRRASSEDIGALPGIGAMLACTIKEALGE
jgi:excinuclease ABC subunit C